MFNSFNGLELKLLRLFNELSLEDVALKVNKSKQYIHKLETGLSYPSDDLLSQLSMLFDVKEDFFLSNPFTITRRSSAFPKFKIFKAICKVGRNCSS